MNWLTGGGAPIFAIIYTHHSWHLYALEGSGGHAPPENFKYKASNNAFCTIRPKYGRFLGPWTGGGVVCAGCSPFGLATETFATRESFRDKPPPATVIVHWIRIRIVIWIITKIQWIVRWSDTHIWQKLFICKVLHDFVSNPADKQTNKPTQQKRSLFWRRFFIII